MLARARAPLDAWAAHLLQRLTRTPPKSPLPRPQASLSLGCPSGQSLTNVSFALWVTDAAGRDATAEFAFTKPALEASTLAGLRAG